MNTTVTIPAYLPSNMTGEEFAALIASTLPRQYTELIEEGQLSDAQRRENEAWEAGHDEGLEDGRNEQDDSPFRRALEELCDAVEAECDNRIVAALKTAREALR